MRPVFNKMPICQDGRQKHPLYETWRSMVRRCYDPKMPKHHNYGGRGIGVCDKWRKSFWAFVRDVGPKPSPAHSLDRIKNHLGYSQKNVRWATGAQQNRNMRVNRLLTANGKTQTLIDWSIETGIANSTIYNRLRLGWSDEKSVLTKPRFKARAKQ